MTEKPQPPLPSDAKASDSWARSITDDLERSRRVAWIVAAVASIIALLLTFSLVLLLPLKTTERSVLLVDRQTGYVEELETLDAQRIAPDEALTRSFLVQYVTARESFDAADLQTDYRKVGLWSAGQARERYINQMRQGGPGNPFSVYPPETNVETIVRSVSNLGAQRSLVRFSTMRFDRAGRLVLEENWAAIIDWQYSNAAMSADDRYLNPLGFQVTRYSKDPETLPVLTGEATIETLDAPKVGQP
jgi:type IV secretion system protein VirB8